MAYINQPFDLRMIMSDLDQRLRKLETAQRLTAPNVNFSTSTPTNPRIGDMYYDTYGLYLKYWNGTAWIEIADDNLGTPRLSYTPTWSGTGLAFTGTPATGTYIRVGKMVFYNIQVACTNVTNFGTGQYSITLPTGLAPATSFQHLGGLHKGADHYTLLADLGASSTSITLYHPTANGSQDIFSHNKPTTLTTSVTWYVSGTYFIA
jgi:hypothetical protein